MEIEPLIIPDIQDGPSSVALASPRPIAFPSDSQLHSPVPEIHKPRSSLFYQFSQILNLPETEFPFPNLEQENQDRIIKISPDLKVKQLALPEVLFD